MSEHGHVLDPLEHDALTELVNIGIGRAAAALRHMVGEQVFLSVPAVSLISRVEAARLVAGPGGDPLVAVRQAFAGAFSGRALLIFPESNSLELVRAVVGDHVSLEDILELEHEALAEIGNIILNGCVATIANLLQQGLTMSLPEVLRGQEAEFFLLETPTTDDRVLFIHIDFSIKGRRIRGYVAMVLDLQSQTALKGLVAEFIRRAT